MVSSSKKIAVIEGDDAAPEAVKCTVEFIDSLGLDIQWVYPQVGEEAQNQFGTAFPQESKQIIDESDTCLFGATSGSSGVALHYLRWGKETYANVRPCIHFPGCKSPLANPDGIDFAIVRENLEDLYIGLEGALGELSFLDKVGRTTRKTISELGEGRYAIKAITRQGTERIVRFAFDLARKRNTQRQVTCVTKHNMLRETDGYFRQIAEEVSTEFDDIAFNTYIVDDFACRLIREPQAFDVVVMPNLYGDILSDAAGGLLGSLGMSGSGVYGDDYAYFEPAHGTAPDIQGKNIINPTATLLSASMMLEYLGFKQASANIMSAIESVYKKGESLTPDQGGNSTTSAFMEAIATSL